MTNLPLATHILETLFDAGVRELCLCSGARSSPLVGLAARDARFRTYSLFEERSAGFFALGRIKAGAGPVAVVTTSGTAAGELLPAAMEAYYSGLPLILVTADRPRRYRGSGAPQTAEQVGLYGVYAEQAWDVAGAEQVNIDVWSGARPLHINVCFEEPLPGLSDTPLSEAQSAPAPARLAPQVSTLAVMEAPARAAVLLSEFLRASRRPVVILGALSAEERAPVQESLLALGAPVLAESLSGLREQPALSHLLLRAGKDALVPHAVNGPAAPWMDGVLRIGGVPTLRLWRDLEDTLAALPVLSLTAQPFAGASRGTVAFVPLAQAMEVLAARAQPIRHGKEWEDLMERDRVLSAAMRQLLRDEPLSEPGLIHALSQHIPAGARLFLGNSLPIREWDLAATTEPRGFEPAASRGLNGIDGQISTFLGFAEEGTDNWALLGDLTAMYDMAGPWALRLRPGVRANIVVVNNSGGKIFERMFADPVYQNRHTLDFAPLAAFWGMDYARWCAVSPPDAARQTSDTNRLIELVPDDDATQRFWRAHDALARQVGEPK